MYYLLKVTNYAKPIVKFLIEAFFIFLVVYILAFILTRSVTGDPYTAKYLPKSPEAYNRAMAAAHFDQPAIDQFFYYFGLLFKGDFGLSAVSGDQPVTSVFAEKVGVTLSIGLMSFVVSFIIGVPLGIWAGANYGKSTDVIITWILAILMAVPSIVILLLVMGTLSSVVMPIFVGDFTSYLIPSLSVGIPGAASYARYVRSQMIRELDSRYVDFAKAKGVRKSKILVNHVLRPSLLPIVNFIPGILVVLITGSFLVEQVFRIPGIGKQMVQSTQQFDHNVTMFSTTLTVLLVLAGFLIRDVMLIVVDPRIRTKALR